MVVLVSTYKQIANTVEHVATSVNSANAAPKLSVNVLAQKRSVATKKMMTAMASLMMAAMDNPAKWTATVCQKSVTKQPKNASIHQVAKHCWPRVSKPVVHTPSIQTESTAPSSHLRSTVT